MQIIAYEHCERSLDELPCGIAKAGRSLALTVAAIGLDVLLRNDSVLLLIRP